MRARGRARAAAIPTGSGASWTAAAIPPTRTRRPSPTTARRRHGAPAAARADQQRLVLVPASTTRTRHHAVHLPARHARIRTGRVTYDGIGTYAVLLSTIGTARSTSRGLPDPLLRAFPVRLGGPVDADAGRPLRRRRSHDYSVASGSPEQNIVCADNGSGGCFCSYDIASEPSGGGLSGRWSTQGALLTHFAGTKLIRQQTDVCARREHDDDLGPRPRRDLGSGGRCARSSSQRMMTN